MGENNYSAYAFPDIELYAGDTTEWVVPIKFENIGNESSVDPSMLSAILTILPHSISVHATTNPSLEAVSLLSINGDLDDSGAFHFVFSEDDTIKFRGKYKYQIDVRYENELRICQGNLYFIRNINQ